MTAHDAAPLLYPETYPRRGRRFHAQGLAAAAKRADLVITVSHAAADELVAFTAIARERIRVVPNGVDLEIADDEAVEAVRREYGLGDTPYVFWVGSLEPRKNVGLLVEAFAHWAAYTDLPHLLVLAGPAGWMEDEASVLAPARRLGDRVRTIGRVGDPMLSALYRGADLFAFPSRHEGFGIPVLEAMAQETPVLAADIPALREVASGAAARASVAWVPSTYGYCATPQPTRTAPTATTPRTRSTRGSRRAPAMTVASPASADKATKARDFLVSICQKAERDDKGANVTVRQLLQEADTRIPVEFADQPELESALRDTIMLWVREGVRLFRVDNPHTKPFPFWEWVIGEVRSRHPDVVFLSEAFTHPKMMYRLAKVGFTQSYTYFTWRNNRGELTDYLRELTTTDVAEFFRPNFFVNTPDINPFFLQSSGRAGFLIRAALATTLSGLWGMYSGFEICEAAPLPGREEYLDSEKYAVRVRDFSAPGNIVGEITALNRLRRANPALQSHLGLTFYNSSNDQVMAYGKALPAHEDMVFVVLSLDPHQPQETSFEIPLWEWQLPDSATLAAEDLMTGRRFTLHGKRQWLRLDPAVVPFAIWRLAPDLGGGT